MLAPYASDPAAGAAAASRAARTLQHRGGTAGIPPLTAGGGLATPVPLSPAQLTPRGWPPTSVSQGAGQISHGAGATFQVRASRGWIIGGAAAVVLLAGVGGYVVNEVTKSGDAPQRDEVSEQAPAAAAEPLPTPDPPSSALMAAPSAAAVAPTPPPAPTLPPAPAPTLPPPPAPTFPAEEKPAAAGKPAVAAAEKPAAKPATPTVPAAKPVVRVEPKPRPVPRPVTKPATKPKSGKSDDLFDSRH
jgi:hypothetical protein